MSDELADGREFLGTGLAFPLRVDGQGHIAMNSLDDQVRQSIFLILRTVRGERMMRPDFGTGAYALVFSPVTTSTAALLAHEVEKALIRFEPRIEVLHVEAVFDQKQPGVLPVKIEYRVRRTDTLFNLVYPFYLEKGQP